jgi:hypothetical protein
MKSRGRSQGMSRPRRTTAGVIALIVMTMMSVGVRPASAGVGANQPCAHGGNYGSTGCVNGDNGEHYFAGVDNFTNVQLGANGGSSTNPIHTNQEMWFYVTHDETQFVEIGVRLGYWIPCSCFEYVQFWATLDSAGNEHRHTIAVTSGDGSDHTYEIQRASANHTDWNVYVDYNSVGTSTVLSSDTGYEVQHGLETTVLNGNTFSGLANHSPLEYENAAGTFVHDPYEHTWIDSPCSPPTSTGNACLTGYGNGSDVWKAAKG